MINLTPMEARHIEEVIEDFISEIEEDFEGDAYDLERRSREALEIIKAASLFNEIGLEEFEDE